MENPIGEGNGGQNSKQPPVHSKLPTSAEDYLESLLLEGIESGPAQPMTKADWERILRDVRAALA